jgi:hypothetical protein
MASLAGSKCGIEEKVKSTGGKKMPSMAGSKGGIEHVKKKQKNKNKKIQKK